MSFDRSQPVDFSLDQVDVHTAASRADATDAGDYFFDGW
jgi:hypothetical protein